MTLYGFSLPRTLCISYSSRVPQSSTIKLQSLSQHNSCPARNCFSFTSFSESSCQVAALWSRK